MALYEPGCWSGPASAIPDPVGDDLRSTSGRRFAPGRRHPLDVPLAVALRHGLPSTPACWVSDQKPCQGPRKCSHTRTLIAASGPGRRASDAVAFRQDRCSCGEGGSRAGGHWGRACAVLCQGQLRAPVIPYRLRDLLAIYAATVVLAWRKVLAVPDARRRHRPLRRDAVRRGRLGAVGGMALALREQALEKR